MSRRLFLSITMLVFLCTCCASLCLAGSDVWTRRVSLDFKGAPLDQVMEHYAAILESELEIDPDLEGWTVTFTVDNVSVLTSLNTICESAGCTWDLLEGDPPVLRVTPAAPPSAGHGAAEEDAPRGFTYGKPDGGGQAKIRLERVYKDADQVDWREVQYDLDSPVTLELTDAPASNIFRVIARLLKARVLVDVALEDAKVSLDRENAPISALLDELCAELGCTWQHNDDDPATLEIRPE
jgi:type II secretory pathway component GspD/PulD (secretin)